MLKEQEKPKIRIDSYVPKGFREEDDPKNQPKPIPPKQPGDFEVKNSDYAKSLLVSDINEDKYRIVSRTQIETKATHQYLFKIGEAQSFDTVLDVVKHYSNYSIEKEEEIKEHVQALKRASYDVSRFAIIEGNKTFMKHHLIERYGEFAINLGIQNEMDTELNMSPEGKLRRKALYQKDEANK